MGPIHPVPHSSITLKGNKLFSLLHHKMSKSTVVRYNCNKVLYSQKG